MFKGLPKDPRPSSVGHIGLGLIPMRPKNEMTNTGMKLRQLYRTATQQPTMAATALTPPFLKFPSSSSLSPPKSTKPRTRTRTRTRVSLHTSSIPHASFSDPFVLQLAETLEDSLPPSSSSPLQKLRDASSEALLSTPWPSRKDEPFRFTDTSLIKTSRILPIPKPTDPTLLEGFFGDTQFPNLVIVDGHVVGSSNLSELPDGVYVGSLLDISSEDILKRVSEIVSGSDSGDLFWSINGLGAPDLTVVYVPAGCRVEDPIHLRYLSVEGSDVGSAVLPVSNPKVLMLVEEGGEIGVIEEYVCGDGDGDGNKCYWTNSVMEVVIGKGGKVKHSYIQNQSTGAVHIKWTSIHQETESGYELIEVSSGGKLSRHNVHVQQLGSDTSTELSTFHLSITDQTQDLHSSLVLDHPRGYTQQLHKCIVAHSQGQAVFDGNVKVNRNAQQTDAGQLTRSLLLVPRATVNVKPNLQIIADDVKCSHGAAISDLEESQLFYFQARGIDLETARRALVFSFGAEVIERLPYPSIREKVENHIKQLLDPSLKGSSSQGA